LILRYFINLFLFRLSNGQIKIISGIIKSIFLKENVDTYYLEGVTENGVSVGPSGKLYNSYGYMRKKILRSARSNKSNVSTTPASEEQLLMQGNVLI
jgi:hypothetical protein